MTRRRERRGLLAAALALSLAASGMAWCQEGDIILTLSDLEAPASLPAVPHPVAGQTVAAPGEEDDVLAADVVLTGVPEENRVYNSTRTMFVDIVTGMVYNADGTPHTGIIYNADGSVYSPGNSGGAAYDSSVVYAQPYTVVEPSPVIIYDSYIDDGWSPVLNDYYYGWRDSWRLRPPPPRPNNWGPRPPPHRPRPPHGMRPPGPPHGRPGMGRPGGRPGRGPGMGIGAPGGGRRPEGRPGGKGPRRGGGGGEIIKKKR